MLKKPHIIIGILIILAIGSIIFFRLKNTAVMPNETIFFVQDGCPHCAKVEEYIKNREIDKKLVFSTKEISKNTENAKEFFKIAQHCGIRQEEMGTPLLWDGGACYQGDAEIINFFDKIVK